MRDLARFDYDVALSFAGEDREYFSGVAAALVTAGVRAFYDQYERATLWGKDLYAHLHDIYQNRAAYTVVFISEHYCATVWPNHERRAAQARALAEAEEYILPARFDDTEMPGLPRTISYVDLREVSPAELADLILEKLGRGLCVL